jgi:hypothetical protein
MRRIAVIDPFTARNTFNPVFIERLKRRVRESAGSNKSIRYRAPKPHALENLKKSLEYTGSEMAQLVRVSGSNQWRKYTSPNPREMSFHMLFFLAARFSLSDKQMEGVFAMMRDLGGQVELVDEPVTTE